MTLAGFFRKRTKRTKRTESISSGVIGNRSRGVRRVFEHLASVRQVFDNRTQPPPGEVIHR
jgi:hypothetical protein